jgi:hypothetical protein
MDMIDAGTATSKIAGRLHRGRARLCSARPSPGCRCHRSVRRRSRPRSLPSAEVVHFPARGKTDRDHSPRWLERVRASSHDGGLSAEDQATMGITSNVTRIPISIESRHPFARSVQISFVLDAFRLRRWPTAHATTEKMSSRSGTASPCSRRSAITFNERASTRAMASSLVSP